MNGKVKKGVVFATYSSLIGESQGQEKYNTRMINCLTGVAMTLMEWYPFLVYYKITELLFVVPFIFYCRSSFSSLSDDLQAFPAFP